MFEALAFGVAVLVVLAVVGLLASILALVWWVVLLPFKLLALVFKGLGVLLALPFLLLFGLGGVLALIFGFGLFLLPALPFLLIALGIWALARRRDHPAPRTS